MVKSTEKELEGIQNRQKNKNTSKDIDKTDNRDYNNYNVGNGEKKSLSTSKNLTN